VHAGKIIRLCKRFSIKEKVIIRNKSILISIEKGKSVLKKRGYEFRRNRQKERK
jgi:hypothetical protein